MKVRSETDIYCGQYVCVVVDVKFQENPKFGRPDSNSLIYKNFEHSMCNTSTEHYY